MNAAVLVPIIVALVAPVGAYLVASRRMSGKIGTSDASQLWAEAQSIRMDLREQIAGLQARVDNLTDQFEECKLELASVKALTTRLQQENP